MIRLPISNGDKGCISAMEIIIIIIIIIIIVVIVIIIIVF